MLEARICDIIVMAIWCLFQDSPWQPVLHQESISWIISITARSKNKKKNLEIISYSELEKLDKLSKLCLTVIDAYEWASHDVGQRQEDMKQQICLVINGTK